MNVEIKVSGRLLRGLATHVHHTCTPMTKERYTEFLLEPISKMVRTGGLSVNSSVNLEYIARGGSSMKLWIDLLIEEAVICWPQLVDLHAIYE